MKSDRIRMMVDENENVIAIFLEKGKWIRRALVIVDWLNGDINAFNDQMANCDQRLFKVGSKGPDHFIDEMMKDPIFEGMREINCSFLSTLGNQVICKKIEALKL